MATKKNESAHTKSRKAKPVDPKPVDPKRVDPKRVDDEPKIGLPPLKVRGKRRKILKRRNPKRRTPLPALVAELMRAPPAAPELTDGVPLQESGVLAFRWQKKGGPQVLLVSKRRSRQWGIPKGRTVPHLSYAENAAKEAFEEAGILGYVSPNAIGMFRAKKRSDNPQIRLIVEVWVYLLEVTEMLAKWPEKEKRVTKWTSCEAAARLLREPVLAHLCHRLAQAGPQPASGVSA